MPSSPNEIILAFLAVTVVFILLVGFIIGFALIFQRRQFQFLQEKLELQEAFQREILQAQLETQNQTLQQVSEELHDNIGQLLVLAKIELQSYETEFPFLEQPVVTIGNALQEIRQLSKALDGDTVQRFGLRDSLTLELDRIQRAGRLQTNLQLSGAPYDLNSQAATVLYRMAQEAINNVLKHAQAKTLTILTDYQAEHFILKIIDDGKGFSEEAVGTRSIKQSGLGLYNLKRRANLLGGDCHFMSQINQGTSVEIILPRVLNSTPSPAKRIS